MLSEWESQTECRTFMPVPADDPALADVIVIPLGWVYDIKVNTLTNALIKYKARLIARGNHSLPDIHFYETYSGVVRMSTVRLLLALAAANSWELTSADVPTAYLQSWLHDVVVYCSWPPGFEHFQTGTVLRCHRSLYGLVSQISGDM